jgi:phage terminase Nu1 subunit (DNA packaging protein)
MAVDVEAVAKAMNITPRRVQQLKKEGMPSVGRGQYELGPCMAWYIRFLQKALEKRGPTGSEDSADLINERVKLTREQCEKVALENEIRRGQLADMSEVRMAWAEHITRAKTKLLSMPSKLGPVLVNVSDTNIVQQRIKTEVYAALVELAESSDFRPAAIAVGDDSDMEPAAGPHGIGLG